MNIFFYRTGWALLLYMLYEPEWEKTFYCFQSIDQVPAYFVEKRIKYFAFRENCNKSNKFRWLIGRVKDEFRYWNFVSRLRQVNEKHCFGDDDSLLSKPFINSDFVVVEDGLANYTPNNIKWLQKIGLLGYGCKYRVMGFDPMIHKVLLSGAFAVPDEMCEKAECIDIKKAWNNKRDDEKVKILKVFNTKAQDLEQYKGKYVLLTQNYDSYDIESRENEYSRYLKILENYPAGEVVIKPHPASTFDYSKYFPDYKVVKQGIPFELMELYNNYKVLISINSTAAFTVPGDKIIDIYNIEGNLKQRYTVTDNQSINAKEIEGLVPRVKEAPRTTKSRLKNIYYFMLRKYLWHLD